LTDIGFWDEPNGFLKDLVGFPADIGFIGLIYYQSTSGTNILSKPCCVKRAYTQYRLKMYGRKPLQEIHIIPSP
jgi:hypothetical protein